MSPVVRRWTGVLALALLAAESSGCYHVVRRPTDGVAAKVAEHAARSNVVGITTTDNQYIDCSGRAISVSVDSVLVSQGGQPVAAVPIDRVQSVALREADSGRTALLVGATVVTVLVFVAANAYRHMSFDMGKLGLF